MIGGDLGRRQGEFQPGLAQDAVEPLVGQHRRVGLDVPPLPAAVFALDPAHFEDVGEIGFEQEGQVQAQLGIQIAQNPGAAIERAVPQEQRAEGVDRAARNDAVAADRDVGIGEVDGDEGVVLLHRRGQQQRPLVAKVELVVGQHAGPAMINPLLAAADRAGVAIAVEHRERVAVLQRQGPHRHPWAGGQDIGVAHEFDDVAHAAVLPGPSPMGLP